MKSVMDSRREQDDRGDDDLVDELTAECLNRLEEEGESVVDSVCAARPDLIGHVRGALQQLVCIGLADPPEAQTDREIGPYRLMEKLGSGGMGTVYRAEQREPVHRQVALKVIKKGMDSEQMLARFERESQALAAMNHTAIAKVYDAGLTGSGQPFFAMELVEGVPITTYCDDHRLSVPERIALFQQVCRGVQHAHQKGILHRDLKPSNVLVGRQGDEHQVKIIDFGLARATVSDTGEETLFTQLGQLVGTPEYMSPEQAAGLPTQLDTRTDVYSLGVLLYELLVGDLPFRSEELRRVGIDEIRRILREQDPPKPSTRVSTIEGQASGPANSRRLSPSSMRRVLLGDLDWIVMRAMDKDPARRYESPINLAMDLDRYLGHEPVLAGPPSALYRIGKFTRKYRGPVIAAGLVFLTSVVGAVAFWFKAEDAQRQGNVARSEKARFDRLAVIIKLEDAIAELSSLQPAWSGQVPKMETWLIKRGDRLEKELSGVRRTLKELSDKALTQTPEEREADRRTHPEFPTYVVQQRKVESLRRAMRVRQNEIPFVEATLSLEAPENPVGIARVAWRKVSPDPNFRLEWGCQQPRNPGVPLSRSAGVKQLIPGVRESHSTRDCSRWA
jgi:serine/threonine protein kinase